MTHLPPDVLADLKEIPRGMLALTDGPARNEPFAERMRTLLGRIGRLPVTRFEQTNRAIREAAGFWSDSPRQRALLEIYPELAPLYLFHGSGFCRQAALDQLKLTSDQPLFLSALLHRVNDWVPEVRKAAQNAIARLVPDVSERDFVALVPVMPLNMRSWRRSGSAEEVLALWWSVPAARAASLRWIETASSGPALAVLATALPQNWIDAHLGRLFDRSRHPAVRAVASAFLMSGKVTWSKGHRRVWVDKSLGMSRRVPVVRDRPISVQVDRSAIATQAAHDPSVRVRRVAADWLIVAGPAGAGAALAEHLRSDNDRGVRARMDFYDGKWR